MVNFYTYLELYLPDLHKQISLSEFEAFFSRPHQTIKNHLQGLVKAHVLTYEKKKRFLFYRLNLKNPLTREYIILCEKERLLRFLDEKKVFMRLYKAISLCFVDSHIALFGSVINKKKYKDIDVIAITENKKLPQIIRKFEETYSKKIHLIHTNVSRLTPSFLEELQKKHIFFNSHEWFVNVLYSWELNGANKKE